MSAILRPVVPVLMWIRPLSRSTELPSGRVDEMAVVLNRVDGDVLQVEAIRLPHYRDRPDGSGRCPMTVTVLAMLSESEAGLRG